MVAGIDGCREGWVVVTAPVGPGPARVDVVPDLAAVVAAAAAGRLAAVAVDIPVGLPDRGRRACDLDARRLLGRPRSTSVFPAPARPLLECRTWEEASRLARRLDGRGLTRQTFHLLPKVREADAALTPGLQRGVVEAHPEVSFALLTGRAMAWPKRTAPGRDERRAALAGVFPGVVATAPGAAAHDVLDAYALAWTARRVARGRHRTLGDGAVDARRLRMEIVA